MAQEITTSVQKRCSKSMIFKTKHASSRMHNTILAGAKGFISFKQSGRCGKMPKVIMNFSAQCGDQYSSEYCLFLAK